MSKDNIKLRPYQEEFIENIRSEMRKGEKRICGVAPCGAGKTIITGWIIREVVNKGKRAVFFVHRKELIEQTSKTFSAMNIPHGIVKSGIKPNYSMPVQIASVQSLTEKRIKEIPIPDLLVCDECHHILANSYLKILSAWHDAFLIGVTATPQRLDGKGLGEIFSSMVQAPATSELIQLGNLTNFKYFAPENNLDLKKVHSKYGDYVNSEIEKLMNDKRIIGSIVENYKKYADNKKAICYCVNVRHSKLITDAFNSAGIPAAHCDGDLKKTSREKIVDDFRLGKIKILCNAELFGEGFDVPNMQAVILARPTQSLTLFIQQAMRPMRPDPDDKNKVAIIIDHVQNYSRFGLPDMEREWTLDPSKPKNREGEQPLMKCPHCECLIPISSRFCPNCSEKIVHEEDSEDKLKEHSGDLKEIYDSTLVQKNSPTNRQRIFHSPKSIEDFIQIAKAKKYKLGWAAIQATRFAKTFEDFKHIAEMCNYKKGWAWHHWQKSFDSDDLFFN